VLEERKKIGRFAQELKESWRGEDDLVSVWTAVGGKGGDEIYAPTEG